MKMTTHRHSAWGALYYARGAGKQRRLDYFVKCGHGIARIGVRDLHDLRECAQA